MIGKGITGTLSAPYTLSQWNWSIGGSTFKSYQASQAQGKVTYLAANDLNVEHPHWFWKLESSALVSCTATITFPNGVVKSVAGESGADVFSPYNGFAGATLSSHCYMGSGTSASDYNHVLTWPPDPSALSDTSPPCINFYGAVGTPSRFWLSGDPGEHCYAQLGQLYVQVDLGGIPTILWNTHGRFDLDNDFPYLGEAPRPANSAETPGSPRPNPYITSDGPWFSMGYSATRFFMHETFKMFQLYHPPAANGDWAWVPLNEVDWEAYAMSDFPWPAAGSAIPGSYVRINNAYATTIHPEWEYSISNGGPNTSAKPTLVKKKVRL